MCACVCVINTHIWILNVYFFNDKCERTCGYFFVLVFVVVFTAVIIGLHLAFLPDYMIAKVNMKQIIMSQGKDD